MVDKVPLAAKLAAIRDAMDWSRVYRFASESGTDLLRF
jgi:hypothetical protein